MTSKPEFNLPDEEIAIQPPLLTKWREGSGYLCRVSRQSLTIEGSLSERIEGISVQVGGKQIGIGLSDFTLYQLGSKTKIVFRRENHDLGALLGLLRKEQHIELCLTSDVESTERITGFENIHFIPRSIPEFDFDEISLQTKFLDHLFDSPFLITGMTGGVVRGSEINRRLAVVASRLNIPMGVGSQRVALEHPEHADQFRLKPHAPNLYLIANLGISQLIKDSLDLARKAIDMIEADAIAIHINLLQEAIQPEGDRVIARAYQKIEELVKSVNRPVIIKEVGCGLDPKTAQRLISAGVRALDVGGSGGTSWGWIEGLRGQSALTQNLGREFRDWGIPTAHALAALTRENSMENSMEISMEKQRIDLIATGGMRGGIMAAKALALGANMVGVGLPLFRAASQSEDAAFELLCHWIDSLKRVLWATNSRTPKDLSQAWTIGRPYQDELIKLLNSQRNTQL